MVQQSAIPAVMTGAFNALNTTAFTALSRIYKYRVPQGAAYPYAVLQVPIETRMDCMGAPGKSVLFEIKIASQDADAEPFTILSKAVELLHYSTGITVSGHTVMAYQYEDSDAFDEDIDGVLTRYAVGFVRARVWQDAT